MSLLEEPGSVTGPVITPEQYFEGYIALRNCFEDPSQTFAAFRSQEADGQIEYLDGILHSDDPMQRIRLIAVPLGSAVSTGTTILKSQGEQGLTTRADFRDKLQRLLRQKYQQAVEATLPDYKKVPPFPLKRRRLMAALLRGYQSQNALQEVRSLLESEGFFDA